MQTERHTVEHQLVLTAYLIDVDRRQSLLGYARHRNIETYVALLPPVWRAVRDNEHLSACFCQTLNDLSAPDILTDRKPQADPAEIHRSWHRARHEHAFFIEYAVVGKINLVAQGSDGAAIEQRDSVMKLPAVEPWRANQQSRTRGGSFSCQRFDG